MRILFVIIFTTFPRRGCNFALLGIYSNLLLLAQGHFHNYICLRFHIGQSEVIFFFLCSLVCKAEHAGAASCFTFGHLESVFFFLSDRSAALNRARDPSPKPLGTWDESGPGAGEEQVCPRRQLRRRFQNGENAEQTCRFCGDVSLVVVMRRRQ